jgi:ribosome-binding protein aMBF1 (putative translation factor)
VTKDDAQTIGAELRQQIVDAAATNKVQDAILAKRLAELDRDVNKLTTTKAEARIELLRELAAKYGPTAAGLLLA